MPAALAVRYARALADLVEGPGAPAEAVTRDLEAFEKALAESEDLHKVLESPAVTPVGKRRVIVRLAALLAVSDLVRRFLLVVADHRRMRLLHDIREAFESVMDERAGAVRVDVMSARELTPARRDELLAELGRITGKKPRARFSIREDLIGGVMASVGSTVYDGSIRGQLEALKQRLAGIGS